MVTPEDIARMRAQLFFEGIDERARVSRFWLLLVLSAIIASAGVAGDSTATVIGAMIVAPLMSPILGTVLAMVLNDRTNLLRCVGAVVLGAVVVIAIGFLVGLTHVEPVVAATNSQVAGRVSPKLLDLVAALATGAVGSIALVRSDISDTLPGVAIAISLVPPLTVVGLTLESGAPSQAWGALLLFLANVSAILATAAVTMGVYGLFRSQGATERSMRGWMRPGVLVIGALVLVVAVPLATSSVVIVRTMAQQDQATSVATSWASDHGWQVVSVAADTSGLTVRALGPLPMPSADELRTRLDAAGLVDIAVMLELVPGSATVLPPSG